MVGSNHILKALIAIAPFAMAASCTANEDASTTRAEPASSQSVPAPTRPDVTKRISAADDGKAVLVSVGETFAVELIGTPTAGYAWNVVDAPPMLERTGEAGGPTSEAQNQPGFAGGDHWEVFFFKATGPGEGQLVLEQRRVWEEGGSPNNSFSVFIKAE